MSARIPLSTSILFLFVTGILSACSEAGLDEKGFQVGPVGDPHGSTQASGLNRDSLGFDTRPSNVLLTGVQHVRLATIYKVNHRKDDSSLFIGSNNFHYSYAQENAGPGNTWNGHLMPGFEAVYGYNLVNISHFDVTTSQQKLLYERPVLIKTLYYPSFSRDTLHHVPVMRSHFIITLFDEDTNKDGYIDPKDLRRMHLFDVNGVRQKDPVPDHYSVLSSEYDPANDRMTVFAALDADRNGKRDDAEPLHIYWIDLKDPSLSGRQY